MWEQSYAQHQVGHVVQRTPTFLLKRRLTFKRMHGNETAVEAALLAYQLMQRSRQVALPSLALRHAYILRLERAQLDPGASAAAGGPRGLP
jgi:hypothetical protein